MSVTHSRQLDDSAAALVQRNLVGEAMDSSSSMLVFVADEDMRYIAVNAAACRVLGYSRAEILDLRVTDIAIEPAAANQYAEMVEKGNASGTARLRTKTGETVTFAYHASDAHVAGSPYYVAVGVVEAVGVRRGDGRSPE